MMEPVQNWECDNLPFSLFLWSEGVPLRNLLLYPLMWTGVIEILDVFPDHAMQVPFSQNQDVIKTFSPHTAQKLFAERVGFRSAIGRLQDFNRASLRDSHEGFPTQSVAIAIPNQKARRLAVRRGFAQLLRDPGVSRVRRYAKVNLS